MNIIQLQAKEKIMKIHKPVNICGLWERACVAGRQVNKKT